MSIDKVKRDIDFVRTKLRTHQECRELLENKIAYTKSSIDRLEKYLVEFKKTGRCKNMPKLSLSEINRLLDNDKNKFTILNTDLKNTNIYLNFDIKELNELERSLEDYYKNASAVDIVLA